jgi:hypothetical protein
MAKPKPQRSRVFIPIPSNWDNLTQEQRDAAVLEIAEALQRQLGVTNGKIDQRKAVDAVRLTATDDDQQTSVERREAD